MKNLYYILSIFLLSVICLLGEERIETYVDDNQLTIKDIDVYANCCSSYQNEINISNSNITITQRDTTVQKCKCMCYFDLSSTVSQLPNGTYNLIILREELTKYGYPENKKITIAKKKITIDANQPKIPLSYDFKQAPCKKSTDANQDIYPKNGLEVFPNPASSFVTLRFDMKSAGDVHIKILNFLGKELTTIKRYNLDEGIQTISFEMNDLPSGFYVGKLITSNGQNYSFRITWSK